MAKRRLGQKGNVHISSVPQRLTSVAVTVETNPSVIKYCLTTAADGREYPAKHYSLQAVSYRCSSMALRSGL